MREKCDLIAEGFRSAVWYFTSYREAPEFYRYYIGSRLAVCVIKLECRYDDELVGLFLSSYSDGIEKLGRRLEKAMQSENAASYVNDIFDIYGELPAQFRNDAEFLPIDRLFQQYFSHSSSDDIDFPNRTH